MEVSSHALDQGRVWGVPYDVAIFTNLTQDHLDYHGTMEAYFAAKRKLFDGSQGAAPARGCAERGRRHRVGARRHRACGMSRRSAPTASQRGDFHARDIADAAEWHELHAGVAARRGSDRRRADRPRECAESAGGELPLRWREALRWRRLPKRRRRLHAVPGRFEAVDAGQPFTVVVDYAHTDDALRNVLTLARDLVSAGRNGEKTGRVLTVFGCGGDRDRTKRPRMGRAAAEASEIVIVTSDNPRSEDPRAIIDEILPGTTGLPATVEVEPDRAKAIALAMTKARAGDIVVIAGKGHEKTQTIGRQVLPFDDVAVARQALAWLKGKS